MKLSIVIPVYNCKEKIRIMIDSLIKSGEKFEIICVNDGSTDNTLEILHKLEDPRIVIIDKKNEGTFKTWQFGVRHAKGDYVTILDQDDYVDSDYIEYIMDFINTIKADILFTPYYVQKEDGKKSISPIGIADGLYTAESLEKIKFMLLGGTVPYAKFTKVMRRELVLEQIQNTYNGQLRDFEDWLTMVEIFSNCNSVYIKNHPYYHYIQYENSVSKSSISYRKNYDSMETVLSYLKNSKYANLTEEQFSSISFYALKCMFYKTIKIKEFDLAKKILDNTYFRQYILKSKVGIIEKFLFYLGNEKMYYMCYKLAKLLKR